MTDAATLAEVGLWLDQYAAASERLKASGEAAAKSAWASFRDWYDAALVAATAAKVADLSTSAQHAAAGLAAQYVAQVVAALAGRAVRVPQAATPAVRNGAPLELVHTRPALVYRRAVSTGSDDAEATRLALRRAENLFRTDVTLVERVSEQQQLETASVKRFRRVLRPELSESGSCGLCIAAADHVYYVRDLMPIHPPWCRCKTMPILDGADPAAELNTRDLYKAAHSAAGSTRKQDLANVRVKVHEHGELGPVLARYGDSFKNRARAAAEEDPGQARKRLERVLPVLSDLEQRAAAGDDVSGPLQYQRDLVARLRGITAAA